MALENIKNITLYKFENLDNTGDVSHSFSTRKGGISEGKFSEMNLSFAVGDDEVNVIKNYESIGEALNFSTKDIVRSSQTHSADVMVVSEDDKSFPKTNLYGVDGFITNKKGIVLVTSHADCVPIFFLDPIKKVIGLTHSGWRGTVKKIGCVTVTKMVESFDSNPSDILIGIGPSIGRCCFEVDENVATEFKNADRDIGNLMTFDSSKQKYFIDLHGVIMKDLINVGIKKSNIEVSNLCTMCERDLFYSHRRDGKERGGMAAFITLI